MQGLGSQKPTGKGVAADDFRAGHVGTRTLEPALSAV